MSPAIAYDNLPYYTYDDYVTWEGNWELINGTPYAMAPAPYPKHQKIVARIWRELDSHLECDNNTNCEVYVSPVDWKVSADTVVQPDVALFCEETQKQYFSKTPPIVVEPESEISDVFKLVNGKYELQKKLTKEEVYEFTLEECRTKVDFSKLF